MGLTKVYILQVYRGVVSVVYSRSFCPIVDEREGSGVLCLCNISFGCVWLSVGGGRVDTKMHCDRS